MNQNQQEARAAYFARWEAVERVKARELAALTDAEALKIISRIRAFGPLRERPDNGMGLVIQQAIFHGKKKHEGSAG